MSLLTEHSLSPSMIRGQGYDGAIAVAKKNVNCTWLFDVLANLLNVVGASCKRRDLIRKNQAQVVAQALEVGEIESGSVLEEIGENGFPDDKLKAQVVLGSLESFDFIFMAHFMLTIFGYTNDLCVALQRKEQDIVNAISLVQRRSRRFAKQATNLHHFRVAIFLEVIDLHFQEIDNRFNEKNM
ncbi:uncharacterized protein LOC130805544 [Amaranthus tricolor]|uniref:uncharacterized protein LOC130805544 n=1 Tax=Amaranthus tricolor TaxID=29722 RepID=UPI002587C5F8|nr:uncharacterized protein LOC130805544 [Amaranthus tricolor]